MYLRNLSYVIIIAAVIAGLVGCSSDPTIPGQTNLNADNLPVIGMTDQSVLPEAIGLIGAYELKLDSEKMTAELFPKRISSIGESFIVSAMNFFIMEPCANCLEIESIGGDPYGNINVGFIIRHPFEPGDVLKPPTARNRRDLDIFDLAMVIVPQDMEPTLFDMMDVNIYDKVLAEASGYTTELANLIGDDSAMPYQLVIDDSITGEKTYNEFSMGVTSFFDDQFGPPIEQCVYFDLYLTTAYGAAATKNTFLTPTYYNPEFNRKAAWKVEVIPPQGIEPPNVLNTWSDNDPETYHEVTIKVYDWQVGATVNPALTNPTDIVEMSEVIDVVVEIPGMMVTAYAGNTHDGTGNGMPDAPLVYHIPIRNLTLIEAGEYTALVRIIDSRTPGTIDEIDHLIHTPDGLELDDYSIPEFMTYQIFTATVVTGLPGIAFQQIDYTFEDTTVYNSAFGNARLNYLAGPDVQFFNLNVNNDWVVRNMPVYPLNGPGNLTSVNFRFPLGVPDGTPVNTVNYGYSIDMSPIPAQPPVMGSAFVHLDQVVFFMGKFSDTFILPPFIPDPLRLDNPGPSICTYFPGNNQECGPNECVPAAVSNSLKWLQATTGTPPSKKSTEISTMKNATQCGPDGSPVAWATYKEEYMNVNNYGVTTMGFPEPAIPGNEASEAQCDAAMAALAAGADVEIDGGHHVARVVGITKGTNEFGDPKYSITVIHDTDQEHPGGCVTETITYCPPAANPAPPPAVWPSETDGGTPGFFSNDLVNGFVAEMPTP